MDSFPVVEVSGSAFEMGKQHGQQAAHLIQRYLKWIDKLTGKPRGLLQQNAMRFLPYIKKLSPRYVEEVMGLAEGAGIMLSDAILCQARAEAAQRWEGGCTAFAITRNGTADGNPIAGQNQDLESEYADVAIVLKVRPADGRPRAVMFTFAGQLGYAGVNEHGVCNFVNALYNFSWRPGLPSYPVRRALLERRSVADCVDLLKCFRTCSALNLVLADGAGAIADVEVRPEGIAAFEDEDPHRRLHTNHYITRNFASFEDNTLPDSGPRLDRVRELVQKHWGRITVDTMKEVLADHAGAPGGICRHGAVNMHSISGYIAEPARRRLHIRRGHGCTGKWTVYTI
jgi:isopenicillin-N N-acyltransferase-like protein